MKGAWILARLPAGVRRRLIEGRIGGWLRGHGAGEEMTMQVLNGYRTIAAAVALIGGGVAAAVHAALLADWPAFGVGVAMVGGGCQALGMRFDGTLSVKLGAVGALAGAVGVIAGGVAHSWDLGQILQGVTAFTAALAGLGIHLSAPASQARAARRVAHARGLHDQQRSAW